MKKSAISAMAMASMLGMTACASNYSGEGAAIGAAGGAVVGAVTGGDVLEGAAVGAAAGAAVGYFIDKDSTCNGYDRNGRLDDDCYGRDGYPRYRPD
ncbi:MAG: YMGG-like glycine zipper-containing protein [Sphingorhabdus sp.]